MNKGQYIVFEGPGFSGKSTMMKMVAEELRCLGLEVVETREPGGCPKSEVIREIIFRKKAAGALSPMREAELFYTARAINMAEVVLPALGRGAMVLKDRDFMSTIKYQEESGMSRYELLELHKKLYVELGFPDPDLRLMLHITEGTLRKRLDRGSEGDPFDKECFNMVTAYGAEAADIARGRGIFVGNTEVVNANLPIEVVKESCLRIVGERLGLDEDIEGKRRGVER